MAFHQNSIFCFPPFFPSSSLFFLTLKCEKKKENVHIRKEQKKEKKKKRFCLSVALFYILFSQLFVLFLLSFETSLSPHLLSHPLQTAELKLHFCFSGLKEKGEKVEK